MIESFKIKGFKQFDDLFLQQLNLLTLIGGKNNTGKTSVLESLFLFYDSMNPEATLRHLSCRGIGAISFNPDFVWLPIFNACNKDKIIEMEICECYIKEKIKVLHVKDGQKILLPLRTTQNTLPIVKTNQQSLNMESLNFKYYIIGLGADQTNILNL